MKEIEKERELEQELQAMGVDQDVDFDRQIAVSYTHLDVYKRQGNLLAGTCGLQRTAGRRGWIYLRQHQAGSGRESRRHDHPGWRSDPGASARL